MRANQVPRTHVVERLMFPTADKDTLHSVTVAEDGDVDQF